MHCKSCEILVEDQLKEVNGIEYANVDHGKGRAEIFFRGGQPDMSKIEAAVKEAGYSLGREEKSFFSKNPSDYKDLGIAFLFLVGMYYILKGMGLTDINVNPSSDNLTVPVVLLIGLTAGVSTCMALVGGLVLGLSAKHNELHPEATAMEKFRPHVFFNLGRVLSYAFFGGLLGLLGSAFQFSSTSLGLLTIAVGLVMLLMGLQLIDIFPWANKLKLTLPKGLSRMLGMSGHQKEYSHKGSVVMGALTFFLPCGFTQAMQVYAVGTGSFLWGAIVMGAFALGTAPGLLGIGGLTSLVKGAFSRRFFKFAGLVVLVFALFNISNGVGLAGFDLSLEPSAKTTIASDPNVTIENGVQVVRMKETNRGYEPNKFTIKKGLPVKWIIDAQAPYSCASALVVPSLDVRKNLTAGENIIEFTPKEAGKLRFSCSMGMYTGVFNVVDKDSDVLSASQEAAADPAPASGTCGGSGGGSGGCGGCGGGKKFTPSQDAGKAAVTDGEFQLIETTYTANEDIQPNTFTVKSGQPVKFVVDAKEDGVGCMYQIKIPGLWNKAIDLEAGKKVVMTFTPKEKGQFPITCGMGMQRGVLIVN